MDRRTLLTLATAVGIAGATQISHAFGQRAVNPLKLSVPSALQGVNQAVLGSVAVAFLTERLDAAVAGGGLTGSAFGGRSSVRSKLEGLNEADFQAATDAAYVALLAKLAAANITLNSPEALLAEVTKAGAGPIEPGGERDFIWGRNNRGKLTIYTPTQQGVDLAVPSWVSNMGRGSLSEAFNLPKVMMAFTAYARASGHHVINALLVVDFADATGYGGYSRNTSSVAVKASLAALANASHLSVFAPNGKVGIAALNAPIAMGGDYGSYGDTTSATQRNVQMAVNVIGVFGGIGANSRKNYTMAADAPKWRDGVAALSGEAFGTLVGGIGQ